MLARLNNAEQQSSLVLGGCDELGDWFAARKPMISSG
jgi:hypothetical protein